MALTSTIEYCEDRDLQDVFPHLSEYDLKRRIYNQEGQDFYIIDIANGLSKIYFK